MDGLIPMRCEFTDVTISERPMIHPLLRHDVLDLHRNANLERFFGFGISEITLDSGKQVTQGCGSDIVIGGPIADSPMDVRVIEPDTGIAFSFEEQSS
jgi:hypothetical protein